MYKRQQLASGTPGQMGEVKLFNPADGTLVKDLLTTSDAVFGVALSPDGKRLAACSADRSIRVFNMETSVQELLIEDHADWVMDVAWSPDGTKLVSASRDKTSKIFDAVKGESVITFPTHSEVVYGVRFSPDGKQVLSAGRDNRVRVWNPVDAKQIREMGGWGNEVYRVVVSPDGRLFACSADKTAREFTLASGAAARTFTGLIASNNRDKYIMKTRVATVGIRGSGNILYACDGKECDESISGAAPGETGSMTTSVPVLSTAKPRRNLWWPSSGRIHRCTMVR